MTNAEYYKLKVSNFEDLKVGDRFMTIGNETYTKTGRGEAELNCKYDDDTYGFSFNSEVRKLKPLKK